MNTNLFLRCFAPSPLSPSVADEILSLERERVTPPIESETISVRINGVASLHFSSSQELPSFSIDDRTYSIAVHLSTPKEDIRVAYFLIRDLEVYGDGQQLCEAGADGYYYILKLFPERDVHGIAWRGEASLSRTKEPPQDAFPFVTLDTSFAHSPS
jgi:hypothetical protein